MEAQQQRADTFAEQVRPVLVELEAQGVASLPKLAAALNARGVLSPRGGKWYPASVAALKERLAG